MSAKDSWARSSIRCLIAVTLLTANARSIQAGMALAARRCMKIAVFRPLGLGELLLTVPALRALDAAYPAAHITLVGAARSRPLALRLRRYVDGYLEFPGFPGIPG